MAIEREKHINEGLAKSIRTQVETVFADREFLDKLQSVAKDAVGESAAKDFPQELTEAATKVKDAVGELSKIKDAAKDFPKELSEAATQIKDAAKDLPKELSEAATKIKDAVGELAAQDVGKDPPMELTEAVNKITEAVTKITTAAETTAPTTTAAPSTHVLDTLQVPNVVKKAVEEKLVGYLPGAVHAAVGQAQSSRLFNQFEQFWGRTHELQGMAMRLQESVTRLQSLAS